MIPAHRTGRKRDAPTERNTLRTLAYALLVAGVSTLWLAVPSLAAEGPTDAGISAALEAAIVHLQRLPPLAFFAGFVFATFIPFPIMVFYLAAGATYGIAPSLGWIAGSLVVSNVLIHAASRSILRPALEAIVTRRGQRPARFDSVLDETLFIVLIRITPGIPYFLQNLILAVARLDLLRFVVLSVAIQMLYATGFVVLGRSALDGELGWAAGGLAVVVALTAAARVLVKRREARTRAANR